MCVRVCFCDPRVCEPIWAAVAPNLGVLNNRPLFLTILEAASSRTRHQQIWCFLGASTGAPLLRVPLPGGRGKGARLF